MDIRQRLLGMLQTQPDQLQTLLGAGYDPRTARMQWLGGTLQGLGAGLASGEPGAWAQGAIAGGGRGVDDYRKRALLGYQMQQQADDKTYQRGRDAKSDERWQTQFDYGVGRDKVEDSQWAQEQQRLAQGQSTGGMPNIGLTPIWLLNKQTNEYGVGQLSDNGLVINGQPVDGTNWVPVSPYDLNVAKSSGSTFGKGQGDAQVSAISLESKLPGLDEVITRLDGLAKDATYSLAGQGRDWLVKESGFGPTAGAVARTEYEAVVNNQILPLLRDTFGAQFTVKEGEELRKTLGDPNKTPPEKQAVLRAFIEQKYRDLSALKTQTGQTVNDADPLGLR